MLKISQNLNENELTISLTGRLDTTTAPQLESEMRRSLNSVSKLIFDLGELEYISSAGLRVLLSAQKVMNRQGEMVVCHCSEAIMEIFDVTGFVDILTIEN